MSNYKVPTNVVLEQNLAPAVFVEAKQEYTNQIVHLMDNFLYQIAEKEFQNAIDNSPDDDSILETYQKNLSNILQWNQTRIEKHYQDFLEQTHCKWFEQLLGATFLAHIRVLISVRTNSPENAFDLEIPRGSYFFHRCLIEMARSLYPKPYCFEWMIDEEIDSATEIEKVMVDIHHAIEKAIRSLIPLQQIMENYFPFGKITQNIMAYNTQQQEQEFNPLPEKEKELKQSESEQPKAQPALEQESKQPEVHLPLEEESEESRVEPTLEQESKQPEAQPALEENSEEMGVESALEEESEQPEVEPVLEEESEENKTIFTYEREKEREKEPFIIVAKSEEEPYEEERESIPRVSRGFYEQDVDDGEDEEPLTFLDGDDDDTQYEFGSDDDDM